MNETSLSLIQQLRESPDKETWEQLHELYAPLIRKWLRRYELQDTDADDVAQEVLLAVAEAVRSFEHNGRTGAFRAWVKTILVNRMRSYWRSRDRRPIAKGGSDIAQRLQELDDPTSAITQIWNQEHDQHVLRTLLKKVRHRFEPSTWNAFLQTTVEGKKPAEVAAELGLSLNAVVVAKSRVISRLRREAKGLVEASSNFFG